MQKSLNGSICRRTLRGDSLFPFLRLKPAADRPPLPSSQRKRRSRGGRAGKQGGETQRKRAINQSVPNPGSRVRGNDGERKSPEYPPKLGGSPSRSDNEEFLPQQRKHPPGIANLPIGSVAVRTAGFSLGWARLSASSGLGSEREICPQGLLAPSESPPTSLLQKSLNGSILVSL